MSILRGVALQSITTLARGKKISPEVLCIGGPLNFIPSLKECFADLLDIDNSQLVLPPNSEYFPVWGAALYNQDSPETADLKEIIVRMEQKTSCRSSSLPALFKDENDYRQWKKNGKIKSLNRVGLKQGETINCLLGIDSGSTTTKIVIIDTKGDIRYSFYDSNRGKPLKKVVEGLGKFFDEARSKDVKTNFLASTVTGYGEDLVKSALNLDYGVVETMAHLSGAQFVDPEVSFASTMNMSLGEFSKAACMAEFPSDLGTRCTVFMNSKVKQSLRENVSMGDIAAGLAYLVVKNCHRLSSSNLNCFLIKLVVNCKVTTK